MRTHAALAFGLLWVLSSLAIAEPSYKGRPLSEWCAELKAKTRFERAAAARAMTQLGPEATAAVRPLVVAFHAESHADLREAYVAALEKIGPDAAGTAVPDLVRALLGPKEREASLAVRARIVRTVLVLDPKMKHFPKLMAGLEDEESLLIVLGAVGPPQTIDETFPPLKQLAGHPVARVRAAAIGAVGRLDPELDTALASVGAALADVDPGVRLAAIQAATTAGERAAKLIPELTAAFGKAEGKERVALIEAGLRIAGGDKATHALLRRALVDKDGKIRLTAVRAIETGGEKTLGLLSDLKTAFDLAEPAQQAEILAVMLRTAPDCKAVVPSLRGLLSDPAPSNRKVGVLAITATGDKLSAYLQELLPALADSDPEVAASALQAVLKADPELSGVGRDLFRTALRDKSAVTRANTAALLAITGEKCRPFLPDFRLLSGDSDPEVRWAALPVIAALEPDRVQAGLDLPAVLPADTEAVGRIRVRSVVDLFLKDEKLHKLALEELNRVKVLSQFRFDPLKDVSAVTVSLQNPVKILSPDPGTLVVLEGKFTGEEIGKVREARQDERQTLYAACLDRGTVVFGGKRATAEEAIKRAEGDKAGAGLPAMKRAFADVDPKSLAWAAVALSDEARDLLKLFKNPDGLEAVTAHADISGERCVTRIRFLTKDKDSAERWAEFLGGLRREAGAVPEAKPHADAVTVTHASNTVTVRFAIPIDQLRRRLSSAPPGGP